MCLTAALFIMQSMDRSPEAAPGYGSTSQTRRDTHLIHQVDDASARSASFYVSSVVIADREPMIVDTGTGTDGSRRLDDVFGLVDAANVRWILISHADELTERPPTPAADDS
jgi:glyoxylase-like metal-dependent hydrolase (beta-lactamase superfamily II)